jgi:hypothetical protein
MGQVDVKRVHVPLSVEQERLGAVTHIQSHNWSQIGRNANADNNTSFPITYGVVLVAAKRREIFTTHANFAPNVYEETFTHLDTACDAAPGPVWEMRKFLFNDSVGHVTHLTRKGNELNVLE